MTSNRFRPIALLPMALALALIATGCALGPAYQVPEAMPVPAAYREAPGWAPARPDDAADRGPWWELFQDADLNSLIVRVEVSNQNVAAAAAAYAQAKAVVGEQRALLLPEVGVSGGASRSGGEARNSGTSAVYQTSINASWEADVWGRLRGAVQAGSARAQASAADLASARLSAQGDLAIAYLSLRQTDAQKSLVDATLAAYEKSLQIARNRYEAGIAPNADVLQAQTQLASVRADAIGLASQRARYEHAIAVLIGESPSQFSIGRLTTSATAHVPDVPPELPSELLQRRPDIAAAERRVASANAQIGIERSAYFPSIGLSASRGFSAGRAGDLFNASTSLWSLGLSAAQTLFDAGLTRARVEGARAAHEETVARYRQTVLQAFQAVEDQLVAIRVLGEQQAQRLQASRLADEVEQQTLNRYRAGQIGFSEVINAQATALNARRALSQLLADRQVAAVLLVQALGGRWVPETGLR